MKYSFMLPRGVSVLLMMILFVASVTADEARVPIYGVTTISSPGHYYLARNISVSTNIVVITISASNTIKTNSTVAGRNNTTALYFRVFSPINIYCTTSRIHYGQFLKIDPCAIACMIVIYAILAT